MANVNKKDRLKKWLIIGAVALLAVMLVSVFVKLGGLEKTKNVGFTNYAIGDVSVEDGKILESKQHIYTKGHLKTQDIEITLDEDATITYKVYFYDEDKEFISATNALNADYTANSTPEGAKYCRVVITPAQVDGEAVTVTAFNMAKYTSQVKIVVTK